MGKIIEHTNHIREKFVDFNMSGNGYTKKKDKNNFKRGTLTGNVWKNKTCLEENPSPQGSLLVNNKKKSKPEGTKSPKPPSDKTFVSTDYLEGNARKMQFLCANYQ